MSDGWIEEQPNGRITGRLYILGWVEVSMGAPDERGMRTIEAGIGGGDEAIVSTGVTDVDPRGRVDVARMIVLEMLGGPHAARLAEGTEGHRLRVEHLRAHHGDDYTLTPLSSKVV